MLRRLFPSALTSIVIGSLLLANLTGAQETILNQRSTAERLAGSNWWPTRPAAPKDKYTGSEVCAQCHVEIAANQKETSMARALTPIGQSPVLKRFLGQPIRVDENTYRVEEGSQGSTFTLYTGSETVTKPLHWAFGSGEISQVYLGETAEGFLESHFSYFGRTKDFDITPAQQRAAGSLAQAEGRRITRQEGRRCFSCHAANVPPDGTTRDILPGVTCEACHGPGGSHVAAAKSGLQMAGSMITNPGQMSPVDQVDFCGACHMTTLDVENSGAVGLPTVRFPAYRLQNSKCWGDGDARITCTACHDPHKPLSREAAHYDQRCLSCHVNSTSKPPDEQHPAPACKVQSSNCASCHMPRYEFADTYHSFTDHNIRVVSPSENKP